MAAVEAVKLQSIWVSPGVNHISERWSSQGLRNIKKREEGEPLRPYAPCDNRNGASSSACIASGDDGQLMLFI